MLLGVISHRRTTTPTRLGHAIRLNKYSCVLHCWPSLRIKCWIPIYPFFSCSALKIVLLRAIPLQVHYYGRNEMYFCGTRHSRHTVDVWKITLFTIYNLFCFSLGSYSDKYFSLQFWQLDYISQFIWDINHISGTNNVTTDALSRTTSLNSLLRIHSLKCAQLQEEDSDFQYEMKSTA